MPGNGCRADKADGTDLGMVAEGVDHFFPTVDEVYDTFGQTCLFQKLESAVHGERNALGWLQNESISARDRVGEEPVRDHRGKIEGHDGGNDSERLADLHFVHARSHVLEVVALHHHGNAAGDFDVFDGAAEFGACFGKGLAVFERDDAGEVVEILFEKIFQFKEILDALARRGAAPRWESIGGGLNGSVDVGGSREGGARQQFGSGRVGDVHVFGGGGPTPGAVHVILKVGDLSGDGTAHTQLLGLCWECGKRPAWPTR